MPKVKYQGTHKILITFRDRAESLDFGDTLDCSDLEAQQLAADDVASKRKGRCKKWLIEKPKPARKGKE